MQAAGDLVGGVFELAPGVKDREHDLGGRAAALVHVHRDAAPVVNDGKRAVDVNRDVDVLAETRQRLVDGVVDDFVDEVVQPGRTGRSDVHRRTFADGFEALEDLDFVRAVFLGGAWQYRARHVRGLAVLGVSL